MIEGVEVITYQGKIYIPVQLQQRVVAWYHEYLAHPGKSQTEATLCQTCTWPKLHSYTVMLRHSARHVVLANCLRKNGKSMDTYHQKKQKNFRGLVSTLT
jgi:hypothetical protein